MKNKLLASILTACMLLTMLPTAAFAAEAEAEPGTDMYPEFWTHKKLN